MIYFTREDHAALTNCSPADLDERPALRDVYQRLLRLHEFLHSQLRTNNMDLHVLKGSTFQPLAFDTIGGARPNGTLSIHYLRSETQAVVVERLMGRDEVMMNQGIDPRRHPVIELRVMPEYFVVELLMSPDAWWDQQNLVGKLSVARHRTAFYTLLRGLHENYRLGFWRGIHLSDMHLTTVQFQRVHVLNEWLSTFEPGKDWFRIGIWYPPESSALAADSIFDEVLQQVKALYLLYRQLLWTSDNNYREFYDGLTTA